MDIKKDLSSTFMIANLIATIFVVAIHYNSKYFVPVAHEINWNYRFQEFLTNGVARESVPFFALVSGFFLISSVNRPNNYRSTLKKKARTLLLPYLFSSALILISTTFLQFIASKILHLDYPQDSSLDSVEVFKSIFIHPIPAQFWFLRDLIMLTIVSRIIFNINQLMYWILGFSLAFLWVLNVQPFPIVGDWHLINVETFFFFWLGGLIFRKQSFLYSITRSSNIARLGFLTAWLSLIALRVTIDPDLNTWYASNYTIESLILYKLCILLGLVSLIQISEKLKHCKPLIFLSGYTFFVYLFHKEPLSYFQLFTEPIAKGEFEFYVNFPIATILVFLLAHLTATYLFPFYAFLTGGRSPGKTIKRTQ